MNYVLLLGAGFSRNWGGWLADEAFEYLLGSPHLNSHLRTVLWRYKDKGGFEHALAELRTTYKDYYHSDPARKPLWEFQKSIRDMFEDMNTSYKILTQLGFPNDNKTSVRDFLPKFDAIFTLNQDLLLERHYFQTNIQGYSQLSTGVQWSGFSFPGLENFGDWKTTWRPEPRSTFIVPDYVQPIFKLHGSSNWNDEDGKDVLIIGAEKVHDIESFEMLSWYYEQFKDYLSKPETRLMIIGYGFRDEHINSAIIEAAKNEKFRLFIIDPLGVDVLNWSTRGTWKEAPSELMKSLQQQLIGASRRLLKEIFVDDAAIEHSKVMRFFN